MSKQYLQPGETTTLDEFIRQVRRQTRRLSSVYQFRPSSRPAIIVDYSRDSEKSALGGAASTTGAFGRARVSRAPTASEACCRMIYRRPVGI